MHDATIWRYEGIEIYFQDNVVDMIFSDHEDFNNGGEWINIDPWMIKRGLALSDFELELTIQELPFASERLDVVKSYQCIL